MSPVSEVIQSFAVSWENKISHFNQDEKKLVFLFLDTFDKLGVTCLLAARRSCIASTRRVRSGKNGGLGR